MKKQGASKDHDGEVSAHGAGRAGGGLAPLPLWVGIMTWNLIDSSLSWFQSFQGDLGNPILPSLR